MQKQLHDEQCVQPGPDVVNHDSKAFRQTLKHSHRRRFHNIEPTKKYKTGQQTFPRNRGRNQSD